MQTLTTSTPYKQNPQSTQLLQRKIHKHRQKSLDGGEKREYLRKEKNASSNAHYIQKHFHE
jgi:hypothetical protein